MDDFVNAIERNSKVQIKIKDILDKYIKIPLNYQSKIGYDTLIQNVILKDIIKILGATLVDIDIEFKMKTSRIKYLESGFLRFYSFILL